MSHTDPPVTPLRVMKLLGFEPDPWQQEVLETKHKRILLNCARQAGKSTTVAILALVEALANGMHKVLILSRSMRQSRELFKQCCFFHDILKGPSKHRRTAQELELKNFSRIVCLPCKEETIRGFAHVNLLIIDEAARVPDDLYRTVRPMLAVSGGRMICLSTPYGKRGFFYKEWAQGGDEWLRIAIPASRVSRIAPAFLEQERRALGEAWYRQEYCCEFEALEGLVYPGMGRCVVEGSGQWVVDSGQRAVGSGQEMRGALGVREGEWSGDTWREEGWKADWESAADPERAYDDWQYSLQQRMNEWRDDREATGNKYRKMPPWIAMREGLTPKELARMANRPSPLSESADRPSPPTPLPKGERGTEAPIGRWVGGIDFGFRNPFAAIWGVVDQDNVLWLVGEHYQRQRPLSYHMQHLPRHVEWFADPAGAGEIAELRLAGFTVRKGINDLRQGIGAVTARIENGGLKILAGRCPQLLEEAALYRYSDAEADKRAEVPVDQHNHALSALRYLVSRLPARREAKAA